MRIDMPCCSIKTCKYWSDGNCTSVGRYTQCDYSHLLLFLSELKEQLEKFGV